MEAGKAHKLGAVDIPALHDDYFPVNFNLKAILWSIRTTGVKGRE